MTVPSLRKRRLELGLSDRFGRWWRGATWWQKLALWIVIAVLLFLLPTGPVANVMTPESDWPSVLFFPIGCYMLMAIGLNVVVGFAGLLDLGYVAFFAIGAYSMGILGQKFHFDFWLVLLIAIVLSMTAGLLLGAPTLRLRGDYLAIVTLGFGEIIRVTVNNLSYTGGPRGINGIPSPPGIDANTHPTLGKYFAYNNLLDARPYYYLILVLIVVAIVVARRLEHSRVGRSWAAIREDEDAAELMGVPTLAFKLWAFVIGAAIAGTGGVVFAARSGTIQPANFQFLVSALILAAVVLGGSGNIPGVMLGAFLVGWLPERFRNLSEYRYLMFGLALMVVMIFRPEGLLPSRRRRAEFREGQDATGGMLGAEVGAIATQNEEVDV
ncbi:MAG: branched-chain amino acid ABC transporter permease [Frankiaceae bacterium]